MKKVLAIIVCVCIALTLSVSAFAASSPTNKVTVINADGTMQSGEKIPNGTFISIGDNNTVTVVADEKTYGKFDSWSIYVYNPDGTYTKATEGVDYTIKEGTTTDKKLVIVPINQIAVAGNYNGTITDPAKPGASGKTDKSVKTGDVNVMYAVVVLLASAALLLGAKRQLSK